MSKTKLVLIMKNVHRQHAEASAVFRVLILLISLTLGCSSEESLSSSMDFDAQNVPESDSQTATINDSAVDLELPTQYLDMEVSQESDVLAIGDSTMYDATLTNDFDSGLGGEIVLPRRSAGLPEIYDYSGAPAEHVDQLISRALDGLGFDVATGPNPRDIIFVNRFYIAWIDETGFYGKMNGLWTLNGDPQRLDFVLLEGLRPVNSLVVGEFGNGRWPEGYKGAEHIEFPNNVPEADDNPSCADSGSFCAQYSLNEAVPFTDPDIPTWRACNLGRMSFAEHISPIEILPSAQGLRLVYEGALTKEGDFGGSSDGANCHGDYLFPDGSRRRVFLRVGYELRADDSTIDRLLQIRNPMGNPDFSGPFGFIGGFVFSKFPDPHPLKRQHRYVYLTDSAVELDWESTSTFIAPERWFALPESPPTRDVVLGWARQPLHLSPYPDFVAGASYGVSNHGPHENGDTGFCLCVVHGGIEMGGGLNVGVVPGGQESGVSIRRLTINQATPLPERLNRVYEAETDFSHGIGQAEGDGWSATVADVPGHLIFGPYATDFGDGVIRVIFRLLIDVVNESEEQVVTLDINDATTDEILVSRPIERRDFEEPFVYKDFEVRVDLDGRAGHAIETRVYWHDTSYVRVDRVTVMAN